MGTSFITSLGFGAAAVASTGAYSGGTGQLVPIGAVLEWYDDVLPTEGGYAWANGQIIASANTVCPILLARWGSRFGGNGVTTMGVPDRRETVGIGQRNMGGTSPRALIGNYTVLTCNAVVGTATSTIATTNLPAYTPAGSLSVTSTVSTIGLFNGGLASVGAITGGSTYTVGNGTSVSASSVTSNGTLTGTAQGGVSTPLNILQPSTVCNYILRIA
jgi:microcystin-dependent protein